jgi:hypothetical protein
MVKHAREERLLVAECVEMGRFRRSLNMARALVLAFDRFFGDQALERRDRLQ